MRLCKLNLVGRILLAMLVGVAAGFVLPDWGLRGLKTLEELVAVLLRFLVPLVILGLVKQHQLQASFSAHMVLLKIRLWMRNLHLRIHLVEQSFINQPVIVIIGIKKPMRLTHRLL